MFRPFPEQALRRVLSGVSRVAVVDRDISPGFGGVLWGELRGCLDAMVQGVMVGLGGGDVRPQHLGSIIDDLVTREIASEPAIMEVG